GALRLGNAAALPATSNVQLNGGVLELTSSSPNSFTTGTGAGQVQWTGDGGFAAFGANATLTLNGGATLAWGPGFVPEGNNLMLSSRSSNRTLTLANNIDLGSGMRTIEVNLGTGPNQPAANGVLAGVVSGTGGLQVLGGGVFSMTAAN